MVVNHGLNPWVAPCVHYTIAAKEGYTEWSVFYVLWFGNHYSGQRMHIYFCEAPELRHLEKKINKNGNKETNRTNIAMTKLKVSVQNNKTKRCIAST